MSLILLVEVTYGTKEDDLYEVYGTLEEKKGYTNLFVAPIDLTLRKQGLCKPDIKNMNISVNMRKYQHSFKLKRIVYLNLTPRHDKQSPHNNIHLHIETYIYTCIVTYIYT